MLHTDVSTMLEGAFCNIFSQVFPFSRHIDTCLDVVVSKWLEACAETARGLE